MSRGGRAAGDVAGAATPCSIYGARLVYHLGLAKENGASEAEIIEAITHLAF